VEVEAFLLTHSLIRTQENKESQRYFMLAVDEQSHYAKAVDELERDATKLATDITSQLKKKKKGKPFRKALSELLTRFNALVDRLKGLNIDPKEAIAVELHAEGLERLSVPWNTLVDECQGAGCKPQFPAAGGSLFQSLTSDPKPARDLSFGFTQPQPSWDPCEEPLETHKQLQCLADKNSELARLRALDPPQLEESMPVLPKIHWFAEDKVIRRYNAVVHRYNAEASRRQQALAQLLPTNVGRLVRLAAGLKGTKFTLRGVVVSLPDLARKTYSMKLGAVPTTSLRELGQGKETFASTFYEKARYCITSYPPGAELTLKGESVGRTPRCFDAIPFGRLFEMTVKRDGYPPVGIGPRRMEPPADGAFEIHCTLRKTEEEGGGCKIL